MADRQPVRVTIHNQTFTLLAAEDPREVEELAQTVDELLTSISSRSQSADSSRVAIIACLELAGRLRDVKRDLTHVLLQQGSPAKGKPRKYLVTLIRRARRAQALLDERCGKSISDLAVKFHVTNNRFPRLVRLNYLAPDIIASILDGTQPSDLTGIKLLATDLPLDWTLQRRMLGFPDQPDCLKAAPGW